MGNSSGKLVLHPVSGEKVVRERDTNKETASQLINGDASAMNNVPAIDDVESPTSESLGSNGTHTKGQESGDAATGAEPKKDRSKKTMSWIKRQISKAPKDGDRKSKTTSVSRDSVIEAGKSDSLMEERSPAPAQTPPSADSKSAEPEEHVSESTKTATAVYPSQSMKAEKEHKNKPFGWLKRRLSKSSRSRSSEKSTESAPLATPAEPEDVDSELIEAASSLVDDVLESVTKEKVVDDEPKPEPIKDSVTESTEAVIENAASPSTLEETIDAEQPPVTESSEHAETTVPNEEAITEVSVTEQPATESAQYVETPASKKETEVEIDTIPNHSDQQTIDVVTKVDDVQSKTDEMQHMTNGSVETESPMVNGE